MRVWQISSFGIDKLEFTERPTPVPGPGEALVKIHAISFNYRDLMVVKGTYNPKLKLPRIPCSDGAGEVIAVGDGVSLWKAGDRVAGIFMQNWIDGPPTPEKTKGALGGDMDGMLAEYVVLHEKGLVEVPEHLSYQEAATLPCAAVTAWNALAAADLKPGGTVLIQGTGGVSLFTLQLARLRGARVLGVSSSDEKLERAQELGLDAGLNYKTTPDWARWAMDETDGEGVDLIVEVGGVGTLARSLKAVKMGGTIAQVGVLTGSGSGPGLAPTEALPVSLILHKQVRLRGIYVGSRQDFRDMNKAVSLGNLRPVGEDFPWTHAREVLARMENGAHFGKLVMSVG
ncbi:zinc-dependent alcohol dehydrogenase family protein [Terracidiphilus gabretensis]|jgi:NADPH:quinone reductase-like Zn-dependent oxidoreductase|uniref:zinc-dependent alcohol dehydrogenase family protein n=1 Tax=Terracidiphilus gabretensis TaxID=1577687 RepID=UPI00071B3D10|nr:NAD(P)-dependent alcohol dehydrogenase [Terracidiphilus gabretensis]